MIAREGAGEKRMIYSCWTAVPRHYERGKGKCLFGGGTDVGYVEGQIAST